MAVGTFFAAIGTFISGLTWKAVATWAIKTLVVFGVSKLMTDRALRGMGQQDAGGRVQLPPATDNILPLVYGKAYVSPVITDAKISIDQKKMWYCCTLSEVPASGSFTFGDMYWNGNKINGVSGTSSNVTSFTNNAQQTDSKMAGKIQIYKFPNGSFSGTNTGGLSAIQIMSDSEIPSNLQWDSTLYTSGGKSAAMTNTCFFIVELEYNVDADTTGLGTIVVELTNSITKPGDVFLDYLQNTRYGCAIPVDNIDTASLTALNTYSDELITYDSAATPPVSTQQARYRINGPVNLGNDCLTNLQEICDACDSWLQYSDAEDKWKIVMNKPFEGLESDLYHVTSEYDDTSANLVGGIQVNPIDLNASYNSMQVAYPSAKIRDQIDYRIFDFTEPGTDWYNPALLSPNEPDNKLDVEFPQVNNYIQAAYLGVRKLLQSREDLVISFQTDYSGIQIQAGDVIRVTLSEYGWAEKLFRVAQVQELQDSDYTLYAKIQAFEYNATIYTDNALTDFVLADNTGLDDPNIINTPAAPVADIISEASLSAIRVTATTPSDGIVQYIDFNYGTSSDSSTHSLYRTVAQSSGNPYPDGTTVVIESNDLPIGDYYWSITARNNLVGVRSPSSNLINWLGSNITSYYEVTIANVNNTGNLFFTDAGNAYVNVYPGGNLFISSGVGELAANTYITNVANSTHFTVSDAPIVNLSNTDLIGEFFGIGPGQLGPNSVTSNTIANGAVIEGKIGANAVVFGDISANAISAYSLQVNSVVAGTIDAGAVTAGTIDVGAVTAGTIAANAVTSNTILANSIIAGKIDANAVTVGSISIGAVTPGTISALAVEAGTIAANAVTAGTIDVGAVTAGTIDVGAVTAGTIDVGAVTANTIAANAVTAGTIAANAVTAGTVAANVVTTGMLVIGSVTQARSTTSPVVFENVPFYNWPGGGTPTWPDDTRAIYPSGGASIIPTTDPEGSANVEYTEGSRITIGITTQLYAATNPEYNCIEVWKSGASTQFDRGFNVVQHSYAPARSSGTYTGGDTIHAFGFGGYDLLSSDGGVNWSTRPASVSASQQTFTTGVPVYTGTAGTTAYIDSYGPSQALPGGTYALNTFGSTLWQPSYPGSGTSEQLNLDSPNPGTSPPGSFGLTPAQSYNAGCYAPDTNSDGVGRNVSGLYRWAEYALGGTGTVVASPSVYRGGAQNAAYEEGTGVLQPLFSIFANGLDAGSQYTLIAVGGTGTLVRSVRDFLSYTPASPPVWTSKSITLVSDGSPVLTDLLGIAGDGSAQGAVGATWVAVGQFGMIQVSTDDGDSFTQVNSPTAVTLRAVRYGNGHWIAVGDDGVILLNSGDPTDSADWSIIQDTLTDRNLFSIDYSSFYNTFNIGGQAILLNSADSTISFTATLTNAPAETYDLTRLTFFGSHPLVSNVSLPPAEAQITNGQIFSTTIVDTQYVEGQETTYYLVVGNMNGDPIQVGQSFILVQELKR